MPSQFWHAKRGLKRALAIKKKKKKQSKIPLFWRRRNTNTKTCYRVFFFWMFLPSVFIYLFAIFFVCVLWLPISPIPNINMSIYQCTGSINVRKKYSKSDFFVLWTKRCFQIKNNKQQKLDNEKLFWWNRENCFGGKFWCPSRCSSHFRGVGVSPFFFFLRICCCWSTSPHSLLLVVQACLRQGG